MAGIGLLEVLILLAVLLLLFGASRVPKLARSLGKAKAEFDEGLRGRGSDPNSSE